MCAEHCINFRVLGRIAAFWFVSAGCSIGLFSSDFVFGRLPTLLKRFIYVLLSMTNAIPGSKSLGNEAKITVTP